MNQTKENLYIIEERQPFSTSRIWQLQREYYDSTGIEAWRQGEIPHYITSNSVAGKTYAEIVLAFLRDIALQKNANDTVYLLELGAGHGRFCYHFMKHFIRFYEQSPFPLPPFCYVLSDFTEKNLDFWENHPRLQPFFARGMLDSALFDAETGQELHLRHSKTVIGQKSLLQPLIVIGNYFFDTIPQELFYIEDHDLHQCLLSLATESDPSEMNSAQSLDKLLLKYHYQKLWQMPYEEHYLNALLASYCNELSSTHILFPHVGIRCIERLRQLSVAGLLLLSADKGYHRPDDLIHKNAPGLVTHGSCFSLMVNYHAFKMYCENNGGLPLFPCQMYCSIDLGCLLFLSEAENYKETRMAYERFVNDYGPDDFFNIISVMDKNISTLKLDDIVSILRLSGYDAGSFSYMLPQLHRLLPEISEDERWGVFQAIHQIWDMYYPLEENNDLAFEIGILLFRLNYYKEAIIYFQLSAKIYGYTVGTIQNMLFCYCQMHDYDNAIRLLEEVKATGSMEHSGSELSCRP